nr:phage tail tape measure protein [Rhizobium sp. BK602]
MATAGRYAAPAAVAGGLIYATKAAGNFEQSLVDIQKKSGATEKQMRSFQDQIFELGREIPVPIEEIAKGFERGAAAGIPMNEIKDFAALSVKVADAWDTSAENAANFFAGFNKGMGIPLNQMKAYASLINDLADSGISDEKDIADFVDRAGASLKNFGMTPQQIAAYGAAMLNLKMPSDVAARAMDTVTSKLIAPENLSKKSRAALVGIVGDLKKFSKLSGDQKLSFFLGRLEKMSNQKRASLLGGLLGEGFDDEIMRLVAGTDEVKRNLAIANQQTKVASNSIDKVFEARMKTFNSQMAVLQNNWNEMSVKFGSMMLPTANGMIRSLNKDFDFGEAIGRGKDMFGWTGAQRYMPIRLDTRDDLAYAGGYNDPEFLKRYYGRVQTAVPGMWDGVKGSVLRAWQLTPKPEAVRLAPANDGSDRAASLDSFLNGAPALPSIAERKAIAEQRAAMPDNDPAAYKARRFFRVPSKDEWRNALRIDMGTSPGGGPGEHPSKDELPFKVDASDLKQTADDAGRAMADSGKQAGDSIKSGGESAAASLLAAARAIVEAADRLNAVQIKAPNPGAAIGAMFRPPVNADTGRSNTFAAAGPGGNSNGGPR